MHAGELFKALEEYPDHLVKIALRRWEIIRPLLDSRPLTRALIRQRVLEVKVGLHGRLTEGSVPPVSIASIYRWIGAFQRSGGDLRSLIPYVRQGVDEVRSRLNPALEEIIEAAIREMYWTRERVTIEMVQQAIAHRLHEINSSLLEGEQLYPPSRSAIYRRIRGWAARQGEVKHPRSERAVQPPPTKKLERSSQRIAQFIANPGSATGRLLTHPNQRVECVYIPLDVLVIDDVPLGRPILVALYDCYTGYLTGWALSFEPPSASSILEALFCAIGEKGDIRWRFGTRHAYLGYGVPEVLVTDQAMAFGDPQLQRACRHLGIDLRYEPTTNPPLEGTLERLLRASLLARGSLVEAASCFPFLVPQSDDQHAMVCVTPDALRSTLYRWIVDVYAQEPRRAVEGNGGASGIPAALWQQASAWGFVPRRVPSHRTIDGLLLTHTLERTVGGEGITFEHLLYQPRALPSPSYGYSLPRPGTTVQVTFYPRDLSRLWAFDPRAGASVELCPQAREYTNHLSLWKHLVIRRYARSLAPSSAEESATLLTRAKTRLQEITSGVLQRSAVASPSLSVRKRSDRQASAGSSEAPPWQGGALCELPSPPCPHTFQVLTRGDRFSDRGSPMRDGPHNGSPLPDPRQWRTMTDPERHSLLHRLHITHPRLKSLIQEVDSCASFDQQAYPGTPQCLAILGEAGVGKTTFVQSWIQSATQRLSVPSSEPPARPYVYFALPANATAKGILASCLSALGDPAPARGGEWMMMERLVKACRVSSVRLLFVDELQHLLNRETGRVRLACVELLVQIVKQTNLPVVFLGSQMEAETIIRANPQLERRVSALHILRPFEWNRTRPETLLEFRSLMRTIDHHLPFDPSGLGEEEEAYRMYYATDGILGWIMKLINYAAMKAIQAQEATLSRRRLAEAYETCIAPTTVGLGKVNPFATQDFHEGWHPESRRPTINEKARKPVRYWKEGKRVDQIPI